MKSNVLVSCCNKVAYKCFCSTWFATIHIYSCTVSLQVNSSLAEVGWVALFQAVIQLCLAPQRFWAWIFSMYICPETQAEGATVPWGMLLFHGNPRASTPNYTTQAHLILLLTWLGVSLASVVILFQFSFFFLPSLEIIIFMIPFYLFSWV